MTSKETMKTLVVNLDNGQKYTYSVPPKKAVVNAYYQFGKHNYNTWEYDYSLVETSGRTAYCGNFAARCK